MHTHLLIKIGHTHANLFYKKAFFFASENLSQGHWADNIRCFGIPNQEKSTPKAVFMLVK